MLRHLNRSALSKVCSDLTHSTLSKKEGESPIKGTPIILVNAYCIIVHTVIA